MSRRAAGWGLVALCGLASACLELRPCEYQAPCDGGACACADVGQDAGGGDAGGAGGGDAGGGDAGGGDAGGGDAGGGDAGGGDAGGGDAGGDDAGGGDAGGGDAGGGDAGGGDAGGGDAGAADGGRPDAGTSDRDAGASDDAGAGEQCANGVDDDGDLAIDCADADCASACVATKRETGAACALNAHCVSGFCASEARLGYPSGMCAEPCDGVDGGAACPSGTACSCWHGGDPVAACISGSQTRWLCLPSCPPDGGSATNCRAAYACVAHAANPLVGTCAPRCTSHAQCAIGSCLSGLCL